jgi:hypothetical protein
MKQLITALCLTVALTPFAFAQEKGKGTETKAGMATEKSAKTDTSKGKSAEKKSERTAEKSAKKEPTEKQKAQHARMKDCAGKAGDRKGDERKKFMSECLSKS